MTAPPIGLHIEAEGQGPPLVLLHGWGLNVRVWDGIVPSLAREHRVIRVDLPGHGRSVWPAQTVGLHGLARQVYDALAGILTARDRLSETVRPGGAAPAAASHTSLGESPPRNLHPFSLLGWSLGGQIALELAASTHAVEKLVLVGTTPRFVAAADWPQGMAPQVLQRFANQLATDYRQTVHDFLELQVRGSANASAVLRLLQRALFAHGEAPAEALDAGLRALAESDLRPLLPDVQQPTLVVAGQYDRVTPPAASRALAATLPRARYLELPRAAHAPFLSHPHPFIEAVRAFLRPAVAADVHATV